MSAATAASRWKSEIPGQREEEAAAAESGPGAQRRARQGRTGEGSGSPPLRCRRRARGSRCRRGRLRRRARRNLPRQLPEPGKRSERAGEEAACAAAAAAAAAPEGKEQRSHRRCRRRRRSPPRSPSPSPRLSRSRKAEGRPRSRCRGSPVRRGCSWLETGGSSEERRLFLPRDSRSSARAAAAAATAASEGGAQRQRATTRNNITLQSPLLTLAITGGFTVATCEKSMTEPITSWRNDLDGGSTEPG